MLRIGAGWRSRQVGFRKREVACLGFFKNIAKGIAIGVAVLVPGASGGTTAIVLGVYDRLIHSIGSFSSEWKKNMQFLFQLGSGCILGILLFSRLMETAMTSIPHIMKFLFIGAIIGGLPALLRKTVSAGQQCLWDYVFLAAGFAAVLLTLAKPGVIINMAVEKGLSGYLSLLGAGVIIAVAMVLPGISASFMLLALGMYDITLTAVGDFDITFLIPIGLGVAAGTLGSVKVIEKLLQVHPRKTYMLIVGFIVGSLAEVYPGMPQGWHLPASAAAFALGFAVMLLAGRRGPE